MHFPTAIITIYGVTTINTIEARCDRSSSGQFRGSSATLKPDSEGVSFIQEGAQASSESRMMAWPVASVAEIAFGQGHYFNVQCMESHCGAQLNDCLDETDGSIEPTFNKDKKTLHQSQCGIVLTCLWHEEQAEEKTEQTENKQNPGKLSALATKALEFARSARRMQGADHCTDGINRLDESPMEGSLMKCAADFGCQRIKTDDLAEQAASGAVPGEKKVLEEVAEGKSMMEIESSEPQLQPAFVSFDAIDPECWQSNCDLELGNCDQDIECHSMVECLEIRQSRGEDENECTKHLYKLDKYKSDVLTCGKKSKCFKASSSPVSFLELSETAASPSSFFQLSAKSSSERSLDETRKKTDEMVEKLNAKMAELNKEFADTETEEKNDFNKLEKAKEDSDKKMEESEHNFEMQEEKIMDDPMPSASGPSGTSSFMQSSDGPAFLEPLRKIAKEARSFSMSMRQEAQQMEEFARKKSKNLKHPHRLDSAFAPLSLLQVGDTADYSTAMKAESDDDAKVQESLAKAQKALASLKDDVQAQSAELSKQQKEDAAEEAAAEKNQPAPPIGAPGSFVQTGSGKHVDVSGWVNRFRERLNNIHGGSAERSDDSLTDFGSSSSDLDDGMSLLETKAKSKKSFDDFEEDGGNVGFGEGSGLALTEGDIFKDPEVKDETPRFVDPADAPIDTDKSIIAEPGDDVPTPEVEPESSFLEAKAKGPIGLDSDEMNSREREVARLDDAFTAQFAKLKAKNLEMQAEAKAELDKALDDQAKFEAENPNIGNDITSLMQLNDRAPFNLEKHADEIRELESKWEREAKKIEATPDTSEVDSEWQNKIENLKEQKQEKDAKLQKIEQRMSASVAALKQDSHQIGDIVKQRSLHRDDDGASFFEMSGKHSSKVAQSLHQLSNMIDENLAKTRAEELTLRDEEKGLDQNAMGGVELASPVGDGSISSFMEEKKARQDAIFGDRNLSPTLRSALAKADATLAALQEQIRHSKFTPLKPADI
ncbi:hypothetical protein FOL47_005687 [Perkinsus chesapeaki]|uniref:Uncharacterized protein n=1 Tax=Perkinsus chesapeaki TaxID=330153 RepID=A0A7J6LW91_PERCH|nr:hypothetical protein FOL47_005687 [Perkinsus chesapeaki]